MKTGPKATFRFGSPQTIQWRTAGYLRLIAAAKLPKPVGFVAGLPVLAVSAAASTWLQYVWARGIFALLAAICGLRYEVRGREHLPAGACIVASKHQSAWETLVLNLLFPDPAIVLKRELTQIPLFGWYLLHAGMIRIDRKGGARALRMLLDDGRAVVLRRE